MAINEEKIMIVGCGPGSPDYLTPAARSAVEGAGTLIGARRLLALFPGGGAERIPVEKDTGIILREIATRRGRSRIVVLVTGDPGLYSLAAAVIGRFGRDACAVVPGVSAVQTAFARLGLSWQDAGIVSAHATEPDVCGSRFRTFGKVAVLGGGGELGLRVLPLLDVLGADSHRVFACEDLTLPEERVRQVRLEDLASISLSPRTVALLIREDFFP
jgi:precorrin-6y C5,15-methyltransferase (decarboxylating) CbiE subunit